MAIPESNGMSATRELPKTKQKHSKKILVVAQELKIARVLAGNNKTTRDRALKSLKKWFQHRSKTMPFTDDDLLRIWKGLFYSMWMSDKPLIQEECAENISSLIHSLPLEPAITFFKCGLQTLINEWFGIDQLRLDKFLMFVRRILRQSLILLRNELWKRESILKVGDALESTICNTSSPPPLGLCMHFVEIYPEELSKISCGNLKPDLVIDLLRPFIKQLAVTTDERLLIHLKKNIFIYLIRQSDLGMEYQAKYEAWKKEGFPGSINAMQKIKVSADENDSDDGDLQSDVKESTQVKPLDPRAGKVDVELPQIKFNARNLANALLELKFIEGTTTKSRKVLTTLSEHFRKLASGTYPLGVKQKKQPKDDNYDTSIRKAVNRLVKFDKKVMGKSGKNKKRKNENTNSEESDGKRQKLKDVEENDDGSSSDDTTDHLSPQNEDDELAHFIKKSEGSLLKSKKRKSERKEQKIEITSAVEDKVPVKKRKKDKSETSQLNIFNVDTPLRKGVKNQEPEFVFERNSGVWFVYDECEQDSSLSVSSDNLELGNFLETELSSSLDISSCNGSPNVDSPIRETTPARTFSTPTKELFPKTPWDEPMAEGEYEICIPSRKYVGKMKKIARKSSLNVQELINNSLERMKSRSKLASSIAEIKSVLKSSTPTSAKKVKINTKLNQSQEVHEHHAQILSSPAIPYDANKRPSKPLLKTTALNSPVNPFYKRLIAW